MKELRFRLLTLFLLLCSVSAMPGTGNAGESAPALAMTRVQQRALLDYARSYLLFRLGYGAAPPLPAEVPAVQRSSFVTFFAGRRVIACFGGFHPRMSDLVREVEANIDGALRNDPRAGRIGRQEAESAGVQITFPGAPAPIGDYHQVNPAREGLFVENDRQGVAIVPGEAKTAAWAYRSALRRMGNPAPEEVRLYRFAATFISTRDTISGEQPNRSPAQ